MKYVLVNIDAVEFGAFNNTQKVNDGYVCDNSIYYTSITGEITQVKEVPDDYLTPQQLENQALQNKNLAISLLQQTDWTSVADVGNSAMSNPYLANQAEFIAWRSQVRAIAVTPVAGTPAIFSEMPQEVWQTV